MKRLILVLALILLASPAFAQDEGGGGFGGLFGIGDAPANRNAPPPDRLPSLRKILLDANTPLSKDQESSLSKMIENDIKKYTAELEKKYPEEVAKARAAQPTRGGGDQGGSGGGRRGGGDPAAGGGGRGGFGGGRGRGSALPPDSPLLAEMTRMNKELQDKVVAALKPEQQAALKKYETDQIRKAGGFPAFKLNMQDAGVNLTPEQEQQIQAIYNDEDQQRRQLMRDSQGQPDKAKLDALTAATAQKLGKVLTPEQKKTLSDLAKKRQPK